ncbi:MAG: hypothetical protein VXW70_01275, partial [Candidatus Thermoplasmatota archaeon]|nr:hypothetical protein [Candidatus Thermoplasmatota archaeon]
MKRKRVDDRRQSSLDAFANVDLPSMPDLDKLAKADKMLQESDLNNSQKNDSSLNTFIMPSMSNSKKENDVPSNKIYHNLGNKYPDPPITSTDTGLVVHRAVLNDITGTSTL